VEDGRLHLKRLFLEAFSVMDVAEPLVSFDAASRADDVREFLRRKDYDLVGVRREGRVAGYAVREELASGCCGDHLHPFGPDDVVPSSASLQETIRSLGVNERCFVSILGQAGAIATLSDLEKPPVRMFLFGLFTILEMDMSREIARRFPDGEWVPLLAEGRKRKAEVLLAERRRRNQSVELLDCLQLADKGQILLHVPTLLERLGAPSRKQASRRLQELEALRNNLAHTQEIIPAGWQRIVEFTSNLERVLGGFGETGDDAAG
jgi:hypothetical protein